MQFTCSGTSRSCATASHPSRKWASQKSGLLVEARDAAASARVVGLSSPLAAILGDLVTRHRALAQGCPRTSADAPPLRTPPRIARRFRTFEDLILRSAARPAPDICSSDEVGRTIRAVEVRQHGSGSCWRILTGFAEFALVQSYLPTAAEWDLGKLDALRDPFNDHAFLSPASNPPDKPAAPGLVTSLR